MSKSFRCFIGWHKWSFASTILEVSKRDLHPFCVEMKMGEIAEYDYTCERCGFKRCRIKEWSYFHYSDRWKTNNPINV